MSNPYKEKAKELVDKFSAVGLQQRNEGIACALIAANLCYNEAAKQGNEIAFIRQIYWEDVKKEIELL